MLRLNFECSSRDCGDLPGFKKYCAECLEKFAASQGFALKTGGGNLSESFAELFKLQRPRSLVLLIDDYDALLCAMCREEEAEQLRALLQELFAHIKTHADKLHCVFITGEHSLKDSGLDAAALNITDITLDPRFAACCGCSIEEQLKYAHPDVDCELLEMLHGLYGNYSFDPTLMTKVMPGRAIEDLPTTFGIRGLNFTWQEALRWGLTGEFDGRTHTARELWALGYLTLVKPCTKGGALHLGAPNIMAAMALGNEIAGHFYDQDLDPYYTMDMRQQVLDNLHCGTQDDWEDFIQSWVCGLCEGEDMDDKLTDKETAARLALHLRSLGFKPRRQLPESFDKLPGGLLEWVKAWEPADSPEGVFAL